MGDPALDSILGEWQGTIDQWCRTRGMTRRELDRKVTVELHARAQLVAPKHRRYVENDPILRRSVTARALDTTMSQIYEYSPELRREADARMARLAEDRRVAGVALQTTDGSVGIRVERDTITVKDDTLAIDFGPEFLVRAEDPAGVDADLDEVNVALDFAFLDARYHPKAGPLLVKNDGFFALEVRRADDSPVWKVDTSNREVQGINGTDISLRKDNFVSGPTVFIQGENGQSYFEGPMRVKTDNGAASQVEKADGTVVFKVDTGIRHIQGPSGAHLALFSDAAFANNTVDLDGATGNASFAGTVSAGGVPLVPRPTFQLGPFGWADVPVNATAEGRLHFPLAYAAKDTASTLHSNPPPSAANRVRMPAAGRVVGLTIVSNTARTAGVLEARLGINGTVQPEAPGSLVCELASGNTVSDMGYTNVHANGIAFAAGADLGMFVATSADWAPLGCDLIGWLTVAFD